MSIEELSVERSQRKRRGTGRGSNFMVLGRKNLDLLFKVPTSNRMNLVSSYLVLLAGTGTDHRLTKWSAKACEDHVGIGRPRAKIAIAELVQAGLVSLAPNFDSKRPQYELVPPSSALDEIFVPIQFVTGLSTEPSVLRRIKETNDALALRVQLTAYRDVQLDKTYGLPLQTLRATHSDEVQPASKVVERGVHTLWHLKQTDILQAHPDWILDAMGADKHSPVLWETFWDTVRKLRSVGGLIVEPWVFDAGDLNAEPLFPVDLDGLYSGEVDEIIDLTRSVYYAADGLLGAETFLRDRHSDGMLLPLPTHCSQPALRGVFKVRIEPDSPGRRLAFRRRMESVAHFSGAFEHLATKLLNDIHDWPLPLSASDRGKERG